MAWERRGNKSYYYTGRRENGRVVKTYFGAGALGRLAASVAGCRQLDRDASRKRVATLRKLVDKAKAVDQRIELLAHSALLLSGYRRGSCWYWTKRRTRPSWGNLMKDEMTSIATPRDQADSHSQPDDGLLPISLEAYRALVKSANDGDKQAMAELQSLIEGHPELCSNLADMTRLLLRMIVDRLGMTRPDMRLALWADTQERREGLHADANSPLERLLMDRVLVDMRMLELAELHVMQATEPPEVRKMQNIRDQAHRRFEKAVDLLAVVRDKKPSLDVANVGASYQEHELHSP